MAERWETMNQIMKPVDDLMGLGLDAMKRVGVYEPFRRNLYEVFRTALRFQFTHQNDLEVLGLENIPETGGAILAANHSSWLDVQVIVAALSTRRVHFVAKDMFEDWPLLRHLIALSDSPFIRRGGDEEGLRQVADMLRAGELVCIFPEGTIPGEENIARWEVEPDTGLLKGKTGVARLALLANVPIIPVGLSGTGRAFPPEVYPRMQQLPGNDKVKVTIKFGEPFRLPEVDLDKCSRSDLRDMTKKIMLAISGLIDFERAYQPVKLPVQFKIEPSRIPPYAHRSAPLKAGQKAPVGVLVLHGFTSHISCVDAVKPLLVERNVPFRFPILRGHGTKFEDMQGVTAHDWYADAEDALLDLLQECEKAIVIGHSMGGLVALELAARHGDKLVGTIAAAPALRFADPLTFLTPVLSKVVKFWPSPKAYNDPECAKKNKNYAKFATDAFVSLYAYAGAVQNLLSFVKGPLVLLQPRNDQVVAPKSAEIAYEKVSSKDRQLVWFEKSGHEMFLDLEADAVVAEVGRAIDRWLPKK